MPYGWRWGKVQGKAYKIDRATSGVSLIARAIPIRLKGVDGYLHLPCSENFSTCEVCP
ncbi:hypothetical protein EDD27_9805 [Nonomuraea polychroma]|uniref:Uncharacterized protein n=1 Tax=Nonomuraea polychroma TaxID=46176 RepID=A0A438MM92_9ACTN|nr:hypothetical protein EDD27_9805 [Nonomuraea polychroma]